VITVHHLERSRSHRVLWLLEELGVPYELVRYARDAKTMLAPPQLRAVHPLGKSPVITEDGQTIAESAAILEYLAERHGGGSWIPARDTPAFHRCRYFLHYAEGSLMPVLLVKLIAARVKDSRRVPFFVRPIVRAVGKQIDDGYSAPNLARHLEFLEAELAKGPWLCGESPTIADVQMSYPIEAAVARGRASSPNLLRYLELARSRPAYQRALAKGGPVMPE
jgi:glutathione S-transferase